MRDTPFSSIAQPWSFAMLQRMPAKNPRQNHFVPLGMAFLAGATLGWLLHTWLF